VLSLLLRFHVPTRGRILLDGVDLALVDAQTLRRRVGYVPQDLFLFRGDLARNLRLDREVSDDALTRSLAAVGADGLVARLPGGLHHEVAERGRSLSFGERQLLAFARALADTPPILFLDEATSAIDPEAEARIQAALASARTGRTVLVVAHRLATIRDADRILVLHHGELAEEGGHTELVARGGLYARLAQLHLGEDAAA
jgi:ATP-binding cassette subfamily B protein